MRFCVFVIVNSLASGHEKTVLYQIMTYINNFIINYDINYPKFPHYKNMKRLKAYTDQKGPKQNSQNYRRLTLTLCDEDIYTTVFIVHLQNTRTGKQHLQKCNIQIL